MGGQIRIILLTAIMVAAIFIVECFSTFILYRTAVRQQEKRLSESARMHANLIEAVARFDAVHSMDYPEGATKATISQVIDAHKRHREMGHTGEFLLAGYENGQIVYKLRHRYQDLDVPPPVPPDSAFAQPMRNALEGRSGTMIGLDYMGQKVLAAYEPIGILKLGLVIKTSIKEIRAPFIRATMLSVFVTFFVVLCGVTLFFKISHPIVSALERRTKDLEDLNQQLSEEITSRKQGEKKLQAAQGDLSRLNLELEERVEKRTRELKTEILERKNVQERLTKSKILLQAVFDGISTPLVMIGADLKLFMLNRSACRYYGVKPTDVMEAHCHHAFSGSISPCAGCKVIDAIKSGRNESVERPGFMDPDSIELVTIHPIIHEDLQGGAIMQITDITESKKIQHQLIRADRLSSLGQLSGGIAHEIRNPLSGISLFLDVLTDADRFPRTEEELEIFDDIRSDILRIRNIIKRVLDFAKPQEARREKTDINQLIEETMALFKSKLRKRNITLSLCLDAANRQVQGDPVSLQQVFTNLVINAMEAMAEGGSLRVATTSNISAFYKNRHTVFVEFTDTGKGIHPDEIKNIFNPFYTTKPAGTGLGLAISHQIIERHGGVISVQSTPEKGTCFSIELPVVKEELI